jgi:hypothetical protein
MNEMWVPRAGHPTVKVLKRFEGVTTALLKAQV